MLSVAMIVKNEEEMLDAALESVRGADEIVVVDTGSTDKTVEIAKKHTDSVYTDYKWNDDFAEARNYASSKCTGDWILILDADEVLESTIEDIKKELDTDKNALKFIVHSGREKMRNVRCHRKGLQWKGAAHNYLEGTDPKDTDLKIKYGYSPAHAKDPDRTLRILLKNHPTAREKFYLAREYLYREDWDNALKWYEEYVKESTFVSEIAEAYLQMARCKWNQRKGDEARTYCLKAITRNPNFKEALNFMAEMSWEKQAKVWRKFAEIATNEDVLFER
jgi:glycosyltransferase involved in cell wall biosynthesis